MKICISNVNEGLSIQNNIFKREAFGIGDDLGAPFRMLREKFHTFDCEIDTFDMRPPEEFDSFLFLDLPKRNNPVLQRAAFSGKKMFLVLFECEVIRPLNYVLPLHDQFQKIFTWNPELVYSTESSGKYLRYYWPNPLQDRASPLPFEERSGFCVVMAANKWSSHPKELYSERVRALDWFARHHPKRLDLFGPGWAPSVTRKVKESFRNSFRLIIGKACRPVGWKPYPFYRGIASSKRDVLRNYRFSLCFENAGGIPGYITEKIFDCFTAGVVPVYLGWDKVSDLIPPETFINKRDFTSYDSLFEFLEKITAREYKGYLDAIEAFVAGPEGRKFDSSSFSDLIVQTITERS